jgi:ATP-dependent protease HslVU (ClpYQ) peptidase subunit
VTCIVGLEDGDRVWMGADSLSADGYTKTIRRDPKIFTRGPYLIGFSGSYRVGQLLRWSINDTGPQPGDDLAEFMVTSFVEDVRLVLKDGGITLRGGEMPGTFLIGICGRLFAVDVDFQVGEPACGYDAVGSGSDVAIGAMHVTVDLEPRQRIKTALQAAAAHNAGVQGPFVIKSTVW